MAVISIQTKKVADLQEISTVDATDMLIVHDGTGLKKAQAGLLELVKNQYQGVFDPTTGLDGDGNALPAPATANATWYWIASAAGTWTPPGGSTAITWSVGDWCISNGAEYNRIPASTVDGTARADIQLLQNQIGELLLNNGVGHNAVYRGKYLGSAVTADQYAAIAAGTFDDLYIGDYWTIGGVNYRIAAFDYYLHTGDTELTTHHATLVPDTFMYSAQMNTSETAAGGYVGSLMYTTGLTQAKTTINAAFPGHVLTHRQVLTNAVANGRASGGAWVDSTIELMNEIMVYGSSILSPVSDGTIVPFNFTLAKSQLPLFRMRPDLISSRNTSYWMRDVIAGADFAIVTGTGGASYANVSNSIGVRPAFSIIG